MRAGAGGTWPSPSHKNPLIHYKSSTCATAAIFPKKFKEKVITTAYREMERGIESNALVERINQDGKRDGIE